MTAVVALFDRYPFNSPWIRAVIGRYGLPFWFARVPDTTHRNHAVVCNYIVDNDGAEVRCGTFALLRLPLD